MYLYSIKVPHLFMTVGEENGNFFVKTDYYPRGPQPFGSDQNYLDLYYTPEVGARSFIASD